MRKVIALLIILSLLCGVAMAADVKGKDVITTDASKEPSKEISKGIKINDKSSELSKYKVEQDKRSVKISKSEAKDEAGKQISHTKTLLTLDEKTARAIDIDKDGIYGYARIVDGQVVEVRTVTYDELVKGIPVTFSEVIVDGYYGTWTKTGTSINPSQNFTLGQTFNSSKVTAINLNLSSTSYDDPYSEIAALNPEIWSKMDENSGTNISDSSGNNYHGTATNITYSTGKYGSSSVFNGVDSQVNLGNKNIGITNKMTILVWVKPGVCVGIEDKIVTKEGDYALNRVKATGKIRLLTGNNWGPGLLESSSGISNNVWTFVAATYDGDLSEKNKKIYFNGVLNAWKNSTGNIPFGENPIYYGRTTSGWHYNGQIDNVAILNTCLNASQITQLYYDNLQQLQARTNANATYSGYWNGTANNPISVVAGTGESISSLNFKVPTTVVQNGVTIYNFNQTAAPYTPSITVLFTEDITKIVETITASYQNVSIVHTALNNANSGSIPYELHSTAYHGTPSMGTNNTNATISRNATHFIISTGKINAGGSFYYNVSIEDPQEHILITDWNPDNTTCNGVLNISNSTQYTTWTFTLSNITENKRYDLVYASNQTSVGNATANSSNATIVVLGLEDGLYWIVEESSTGFVNVPAVAVVIVGAGFVGASFINTWYRRRRNN